MVPIPPVIVMSRRILTGQNKLHTHSCFSLLSFVYRIFNLYAALIFCRLAAVKVWNLTFLVIKKKKTLCGAKHASLLNIFLIKIPGVSIDALLTGFCFVWGTVESLLELHYAFSDFPLLVSAWFNFISQFSSCCSPVIHNGT